MVSSVFRKELKLILKCEDKRVNPTNINASNNQSTLDSTKRTIQQQPLGKKTLNRSQYEKNKKSIVVQNYRTTVSMAPVYK